MKNKLVRVFLSIVAVMLVLTGCGGESDGVVNNDNDKTKIVLLLNGYLGDLAWYDVSAAGVESIKEKYPEEVDVKVIEMTTDMSKYDSIIADTLSEDWDVVVAGSWSMMEFIEEAAANYPEKEFWFFDEPIEGLENVYSISYAANEGSFLAGMAAASASKTGLIGFIGGEDSTVVNDSLVGYLEGAAYVNPDIKVIISYTADWDDSAKGKELALVQYNAGVDVIFQIASNAGVGVFEAAKEVNKFAIGSDTDQAVIFEDSDPEKSDTIITSSLKRVDVSLLRAYEMYKENKLPYGEVEVLGLEADSVGIIENDNYIEYLSEDVRDVISKAKEDIINGDIDVKSAYGMSSEELTAFKNKFAR